MLYFLFIVLKRPLYSCSITWTVSAIRTVYSLNASKLLIAKYGGATERAYRAAASHVALLGKKKLVKYDFAGPC